ncbi:MAG: hypothetical protein QOJ56_1506 [Mycobacterium sp.]|jgi:hypothetical protein|nr:hypothetical protein [Mycobacterium sp.]
MVYLTLTAVLMLVLWPAWLPMVIHGSHAIASSSTKVATIQCRRAPAVPS